MSTSNTSVKSRLSANYRCFFNMQIIIIGYIKSSKKCPNKKNDKIQIIYDQLMLRLNFLKYSQIKIVAYTW